MALTTNDFIEFFRELYGYEPFAWQVELLSHVLTRGAWPERIAAPTGSGKTSVIDVHVYLNALAEQDGLSHPRRLVMTVNRRSLIDDHAEHAERLGAHLSDVLANPPEAAARPVTHQVAALLARRGSAGEQTGLTTPLNLHTVRGGIPLDRTWTTFPLATAVLCMTPDMWGSRALFRGYGTSRYMRSMEAGLLTRDCVLVVDEAHLNRQLLLTARRIGGLDRAASLTVGAPALQVVETTATPAGVGDDRVSVGVEPDRLGAGAPADELRRRLATPKPLQVKSPGILREQTAQLADAFVAECLALGNDPRYQRAPVACVVNTVALARVVAAKLRGQEGVDEGEVLEVIGGLRPFDREQLASLTQPGLGERWAGVEDGLSRLRYLVGTQALEVGIDVDVSALVTELAPAAAVVQRAGRVNRRGRSSDAAVVVLQPAYDPKSSTVGPYGQEDLVAASEWLTERAMKPEGLAPLSLYADPPPAAQPRRVLFQRLEWYDALRLSHTSSETVFSDSTLPGAGEDLTLWLRDDLTAQAEAFVVVRDHMPVDDEHARRVAQAVRPLDHELFSTSLRRVRKLASDLLKERRGVYGAPAVVYYRRGTAEVAASEGALVAGDVLVVPPGTDVLGGSVATDKSDDAAVRGPADVYDELMSRALRLNGAQAPEPRDQGQFRVLLPGLPPDSQAGTSGGVAPAHAATLTEVVRAAREAAAALWAAQEAADEETDTEEATRELLKALASLPELQAVARGLKHLSAGPTDVSGGELTEGDRPEVTVVPGLAENDPIFVMVRSRPLADEDVRSERARTNVFLDEHAAAVADRAALYVRKLGLAAGVAEAVEAAARLHDEGKRLPTFQTYLTARWPQPRALAKSKYRISPSVRMRLGLVGWRHEQLSAAMAWAANRTPASGTADLTTWLIGTSHGHGRPWFDADAAKLLLREPDQLAGTNGLEDGTEGGDDRRLGVGGTVVAAARALFDDGLWEEWHSELIRGYGPWGLAYLEALVRAADQTVSGEGR